MVFIVTLRFPIKLPNPYGPLSETVPSDMIKEANKIVEQSTQNASAKHSRITYLKFTLIQQAQVAKYAVDNGNQVAIRRYIKKYVQISRKVH